MSLSPRPCVFSADGVFAEGAIVAFSSRRAHLGVRHGWTELAGPLVVTRSQGNRIHELNWNDALSVYRQAIEQDLGQPLPSTALEEITRGYPFGLSKNGAEDVVRDPIAAGDDQSLQCVGDVPENTVVSILKGRPEDLIEAAAQAARDSCTASPDSSLQLVADCISRRLFLRERFDEELRAMMQATALTGRPRQQVGILTFGEISSHGNGYLEFFNKTAVVAALCPDQVN